MLCDAVNPRGGGASVQPSADCGERMDYEPGLSIIMPEYRNESFTRAVRGSLPESANWRLWSPDKYVSKIFPAMHLPGGRCHCEARKQTLRLFIFTLHSLLWKSHSKNTNNPKCKCETADPSSLLKSVVQGKYLKIWNSIKVLFWNCYSVTKKETLASDGCFILVFHVESAAVERLYYICLFFFTFRYSRSCLTLNILTFILYLLDCYSQKASQKVFWQKSSANTFVNVWLHISPVDAGLFFASKQR